jgi:LPXTG-motif cell wall-anchored protein
VTTTGAVLPDVTVLPDVVERETLPYTGTSARVLTAFGLVLMVVGAVLTGLASHRLARHLD